MPKKADKNVSSATAPKLTHHDLKASSLAPESPIHNSKEAPTRRHRTALARTSSATTLSRLPHLPPNPSILIIAFRRRVCDDLATKHSPPIPQAPSTPTGTKTPMKGSCITRKPGVSSTIKPRTNGPVPSPNKRRNSLSSSRDPPAKPMENTPIHEKSQSLGLKSGENVFSDWKSFMPAEQKLTQPIFSLPLPILGAQADFNTPLAVTSSPIPISRRFPSQLRINKPRSTSEDLYLAHPGNKLSSPALRAATFMYAGPQFHNSPCPAALPPPKFAFGSA
ncbi:hypothetical protein PSTT_05497 [Puccinia striiformis]|uniref:Uncharacterized protein n=1 Tax=Puccinia striiformis TaxID=27350 RepID=A0A2S4VNN7_9BASI|nr:hypothetical protein PSTT_05497 [Puccinia striiformis]